MVKAKKEKKPEVAVEVLAEKVSEVSPVKVAVADLSKRKAPIMLVDRTIIEVVLETTKKDVFLLMTSERAYEKMSAKDLLVCRARYISVYPEKEAQMDLLEQKELEDAIAYETVKFQMNTLHEACKMKLHELSSALEYELRLVESDVNSQSQSFYSYWFDCYQIANSNNFKKELDMLIRHRIILKNPELAEDLNHIELDDDTIAIVLEDLLDEYPAKIEAIKHYESNLIKMGEVKKGKEVLSKNQWASYIELHQSLFKAEEIEIELDLELELV